MPIVTPTALVDAYDLVILDLDGVVYLIDRPIPGAVEAISMLHARGPRIAYATNNASRRPLEVADLLAGMGIPARPEEVFTSAMAAAEVLAERHPPGSEILVVGAHALRAEVREVGLAPVDAGEPTPRAVVQGYAPTVGWSELAEACLAVRAGADWVATNADATLPSPRGPLPGNGALVAALRTALGREPDLVVGKPAPGLFATAARHAGASRPLVVGDRLDTDIEGAVRAGMDSLLVLTGVARPALLLAAPEHQRPTYVATDLSGLFQPVGRARIPETAEALDGWSVHREVDRLELRGDGGALDALRALCRAAWAAPPRETVRVAGVGAAALDALRRLGLATPELPAVDAG